MYGRFGIVVTLKRHSDDVSFWWMSLDISRGGQVDIGKRDQCEEDLPNGGLGLTSDNIE